MARAALRGAIRGHLQDRGSQGEEQEGAVSGYGIYRTQLTE
eukprot:CAMPEP_0181240410 /NCGR_PEP_ID=MMETSP1096-20121128/40510_1 /TAXON_ID=156174 ORGANISM="Chrysochromulina ericina, Strain CCMP281" /NCGR_SAMPLE_ID=MMETSP1096 /ASSEMBLY_ACC=CAM_ASM_000453 /LENGTH=40 /DNA_ID= /DNA_START= /DNA_END= /DNA_ORIENTATION=